MQKVNERIYLGLIGEEFYNWAEVYFSPEGKNLNQPINKSVMFADFDPDKKSGMSKTKFKEKLKAWARIKGNIEINPPEMTDKDGRIIKYEEGRTIEMIYVKVKDISKTEEKNNSATEEENCPY